MTINFGSKDSGFTLILKEEEVVFQQKTKRLIGQLGWQVGKRCISPLRYLD